MAVKRGLGKGIDILIREKESVAKNTASQQEIELINESVGELDINKIEPSGNQPRKSFNEDSIQELAESITIHGLIEPIIVKKSDNGFYKIIAGERRWRAAKIAGLKKIPALVKEYTEQQIMEVALIENIQREDLNPIEEAMAYERLIKDYKLKQDELAERVSKSRVAITNSLRLLKLDKRVRDMIIEDKIKSGHARTLIGIEDMDMQYNVAVKVFDENLSVRQTEKLVKQINAEKDTKADKADKKDSQEELIYKNYEEKLKLAIGTKVNINHKKNGKGKIELEYYSQEDFERIIELISNIK